MIAMCTVCGVVMKDSSSTVINSAVNKQYLKGFITNV